MTTKTQHTPDIRFFRSHQVHGDPRRSLVVVNHETTFDGGDRGTGFAFECHPRFESLLKAAPELLQALRGLVASVEAMAEDRPDGLFLGSEYEDARAAIRKAEGE